MWMGFLLERFPCGEVSLWRGFLVEGFPVGEVSMWMGFMLETFPEWTGNADIVTCSYVDGHLFLTPSQP